MSTKDPMYPGEWEAARRDDPQGEMIHPPDCTCRSRCLRERSDIPKEHR